MQITLIVHQDFYYRKLFYDNYSSDSFLADAVSCYKLKDADESCGGIELNAFQVEFWDGKSESVVPI
jgi:hypothetical protein